MSNAIKIAKVDHKHYVIQSEQDEKEARETGYDIYENVTAQELKDSWQGSNSLRFINSWNLKTTYVPQFMPRAEAFAAIDKLFQ